MNTDTTLTARIESAAESVGAVWPLHSFVTANPLAGLEDRPFCAAIEAAEETFGADGYPDPETFRRAWTEGRIDPDRVRARLAAHGYDCGLEASLDRLAAEHEAAATAPDEAADTTPMDRVDAVASKWLSAFLEEGTAEWEMPAREEGFYTAFRAVAPHDAAIPAGGAIASLPADPKVAIRTLLEDRPVDEWDACFECHLASLPGWTGLLKRRADDAGDWQSVYPITLTGYVAVRLALAAQYGVSPETAHTPATAQVASTGGERDVPLAAVWLEAWEATYRESLVDALTDQSAALSDDKGGDRPDAQLVFCIDTRSEIVRRHIEAAGDYETHGYAGFFGVPMRYGKHGASVTVDACPPIVDASHRVDDRPVSQPDRERHDRWHAALAAGRETIASLESNAAAAFSYVESTGVGYGAALALKTVAPTWVSALRDRIRGATPDVHEFCEPALDARETASDGGGAAGNDLPAGLTREERIAYAATAFELMGIETFARLVVFAGHASHTANNPFESSLDCGACAGNPGGPSARVLAAICNDDTVRAGLRERGIDIPEDTVFLAGEHDTTTDEIDLYASEVPETHAADLEALRADLETARAGAATERARDLGADVTDGTHETKRRAADWAETRPEWGLAGNAALVIGPRELTAALDLDGRSFLHSYDWRTDPDGDALAAIVQGPMVVTQWINAQYYFSTVDNAVFGSGSKVTHNPVGNVGVYQGNGGDLLRGLPRQSVIGVDGQPYHQPLRLSAVIHAPRDRVDSVLAAAESVTGLLDAGWISLTVIDPTRGHQAFEYVGDGEWDTLSVGAVQDAESTPVTQPAAADD